MSVCVCVWLMCLHVDQVRNSQRAQFTVSFPRAQDSDVDEDSLSWSGLKSTSSVRAVLLTEQLKDKLTNEEVLTVDLCLINRLGVLFWKAPNHTVYLPVFVGDGREQDTQSALHSHWGTGVNSVGVN